MDKLNLEQQDMEISNPKKLRGAKDKQMTCVLKVNLFF
jgi:hypothetical protein